MVNGKTRNATARCVFGCLDGHDLDLFEGSLRGEIAETPSGDNGYGWDRIFIPQGYSVTRTSLGEEDDKKTYLQIKPFSKLKKHLESKNADIADIYGYLAKLCCHFKKLFSFFHRLPLFF